MLVEIRDDVIWARHLKPNRKLYDKVVNLPADAEIRLAVDGIVGKWAKMKRGADGRPTQGIKPIGAMATVWKRLQVRRGEKVSIDLVDIEDEAWLRLADSSFDEWYSAEDEEAYGDLRPL